MPQARSSLCERCEEKRPSFKLLHSWIFFEKPVRKALHRLKYRRDIGLGEALSNHMSGFVAQLGWPVDILIPIPLGESRLKERGYNQVAMIAMPLSIQLGLDYYPAALTRACATRPQVGLSAVERQENVRGAFIADETKVSGRSVLLTDDVSTTGATLSSAAETLLASDAREVYAVTVARDLPHHSLRIV